MKSKPHLSFWQIWNMCFGFMGIQFGLALQNTNVSRIFQSLGSSIDELAILWVAAPVTGLLVQPIVGFMSDRTWNKLGRRRPYFLYGAIATTLALFFMPNSPTLWVAAIMLWVLDASINVSMEPFRALVGDMLAHHQRTMGYAMQSFFIGVGSVIASALPWVLTNWFGVNNVAPQGAIPDSVVWSFYIGGGVLLLAVAWTVIRTREYSPRQLTEFELADQEQNIVVNETLAEKEISGLLNLGLAWLAAGLVSFAIVFGFGWSKQLFILCGLLSGIGTVFVVAFLLQQSGRTASGFYEVVGDFLRMPQTMKQLAWVQFFSWFPLFAMWIYTIPGVTAYHYGSSDTSSVLFNEGANWVGILFAVYNGCAALVAFIIPQLAKRIGRRATHALCLLCGAAGLVSFIVIRDPQWLLLSMVGVGIAWASILSVPYAILSGALPANKMGVYMGIFNFFIVIPQILAASILGVLLHQLFNDQAIYALVLGGVSFVIAGALSMRVEDNIEIKSDAALTSVQ